MIDQIRWVVQLSLGAMFAVSAASKLGDPVSFVRGVKEYQIVPRRSALVFALLVILCEGFLSLSHFGGWLLAVAVPLGLTMLCGFLVAVSVNLARKRDLPCFCFGSREGEMISPRSLARLVIAMLGELMLLLQPGLFSGSVTRSASHASAQNVVLALAWTLFVLVVTVWGLSLPELLSLALRKFHKAPSNTSSFLGAGGVS